MEFVSLSGFCFLIFFFKEKDAPEACTLLFPPSLQLRVISHQSLSALQFACRRLKQPQRKTSATENQKQHIEKASRSGSFSFGL